MAIAIDCLPANLQDSIAIYLPTYRPDSSDALYLEAWYRKKEIGGSIKLAVPELLVVSHFIQGRNFPQ